MIEQKRIQKKFQWVPVHLRNQWAPQRIADNRIPLYWIACDGGERYFVNNTTEILEKVLINTSGFKLCDDEIVAIATYKGYFYTHILPMEAIKIEEYDNFTDLDYVLQISLVIYSKKHGCISIKTHKEKGGIGESVILWDSLEVGEEIATLTTNH